MLNAVKINRKSDYTINISGIEKPDGIDAPSSELDLEDSPESGIETPVTDIEVPALDVDIQTEFVSQAGIAELLATDETDLTGKINSW